jgi:hypothetical protein
LAAQVGAPVALQATHWFAKHTGLVASAVQSALATQATHFPALAPTRAHSGVAPEQAAAPASWHPAQAFFTQNPLAASLVQALLSTHSTHCPTAVPVVAQTGFVPAQAVAPAAWQSAH